MQNLGPSGIKGGTYNITAPATDLAMQWDGWGTALKPAHEPIMVAQKPIEKSYCYNVEKWGVGGLNIDDSRISGKIYARKSKPDNHGRFPANVILDEVAGRILDRQSGILKSGDVSPMGFKGKYTANIYGEFANNQIDPKTVYADSGGVSRFFYCPKASKKDRTENGKIKNRHPTVKPTDLIKYLIRLVTPKDGICLDICLGSGTHIKACLELTSEGYPVNYIGFEKDKESFEISLNRERIVKENLKSDLF